MSERPRQPHTTETKRKMRLAALNHIITVRGNVSPNIGKYEKQLLDEQEKIAGYKIHRQFFIKDLGYYTDGYCVETNTIYEVYEPFHNNQMVEDLQRQQEIQNKLNCNFITIQSE